MVPPTSVVGLIVSLVLGLGGSQMFNSEMSSSVDKQSAAEGWVTVHVINDLGVPQPRCLVAADWHTTEEAQFTDANGEFTWSEKPTPGPHQLTVTCTGAAAKEFTLDIPVGATLYQTLKV